MNDVVFFYLKQNLKYGDSEAFLVQKVNALTENRIIIEKCAKNSNPTIFKPFVIKYAITLSDNEAVKFILEKINQLSVQDKQSVIKSLIGKAENLLFASPELHKLLISSLYSCKEISAHCQFINKYINPLDKSSNQEILNELVDKLSSLSAREKHSLAKSLIDKAENVLFASSKLCKLLIFNEDSNLYSDAEIFAYCRFINKYVDSVDKFSSQELLDGLLDTLKQANDSLRSKYWNQVNFLKKRLKYRGSFWNVAPKNIKAKLIKENYPSFFEIISQFDKSNYPFVESLSFSWEELYKLDDLDQQLVEEWCNDSLKNDFKMAKMISARGAEKLVARFYNALGYSVEDTSSYQVTQRSNIWLKGDVRLSSEVLVDVKNARDSVNSDAYSEFCVPAFKQERGNDVLITAVLSPYLKQEHMDGKEKTNSWFKNPRVLGEFDRTKLSHLENCFDDCLLSVTVSKDSKTYLPPWLFDYNNRFYIKQHEIIDAFLQLKDSDIPDWEDILTVETNPLPLFIASKRSLPREWADHLPKWKTDFTGLMINFPVTRVSLPYLFLALLKHFSMMLSYEGSDYSPEQYQEVLYTNSSRERPLKLYDPLNAVKDFCDTLQNLWSYRQSANLTSFKSFKFNGKGLLQGKRSQTDKLTTILAYCGGWVAKKGKCGYSPLVIGKHKNCSTCDRLICPKENCQYCSDNCEELRKKQQSRVLRNGYTYSLED